jgi:hypothetical protein
LLAIGDDAERHMTILAQKNAAVRGAESHVLSWRTH